MSPGIAPAMAIGPVTMWPAREPGFAAMIALQFRRHDKLRTERGQTSLRPETH